MDSKKTTEEKNDRKSVSFVTDNTKNNNILPEIEGKTNGTRIGVSTTDSNDSDGDENDLVIDLDNSAQNTASDRKMDNVFDRILSDVTFSCRSSSETSSSLINRNSQSPNLLQGKTITDTKKDRVDETVRGLEKLEHCLKEFEGKLKQNGSGSKLDNENKGVKSIFEKTSNAVGDRGLQEGMDALITEFSYSNTNGNPAKEQRKIDDNDSKVMNNEQEDRTSDEETVTISELTLDDTYEKDNIDKNKQEVNEANNSNESQVNKKDNTNTFNNDDKFCTPSSQHYNEASENNTAECNKKETEVQHQNDSKLQNCIIIDDNAVDASLCTVNGEDKEIAHRLDVTDKQEKLLAPTKKTSSVATAAAKQKQTSAAWSKLGMQRCENCKFTTDDVSLFNSHNAICSQKPTKAEVALVHSMNNFQCRCCNYSTSARKKFEEHVALHLMAEPYICMTCDITFKSKKEIELHVKMRHGKETVKCGLKGSKRIGQIIDSLIKNGKHTFSGRMIERRLQRSFLETETSVASTALSVSTSLFAVPALASPTALAPPQANLPTFVGNPSTVPTRTVPLTPGRNAPIQRESDVIFVSSTATTNLPVTNQIETRVLQPAIPQTVTTQGPMLLVPVSNGSILIPLSSVSTQSSNQTVNSSVQNISASVPSTSLSTSSASVGNQFVHLAPIRFGAQNITIQGNSIQTNAPAQNYVIPNNASQIGVPVKSIPMQNNQPRFVFVPQGQMSSFSSTPVPNPPNNSVSNVPKLIPLSTVNTTPRTLVSILSPTARPSFVQTQTTGHISLTTAAIDPKSVNSNNNLKTVSPVSRNVPQDPKSTVAIAATPTNNAELNAPSVNSSSEDTDDRKLYFKKCGELYMCDFCSSETPLEESFKEHIWKHFHQMQKICKECAHTYNALEPCKIVSKVMNGLLNSGSQAGKKISNSKDIVMISDDEDVENDNDKLQKSNDNQTERIGLQLKITSTFSLSDSTKSVESKAEPNKDGEKNITESQNNLTNGHLSGPIYKTNDPKESHNTNNLSIAQGHTFKETEVEMAVRNVINIMKTDAQTQELCNGNKLEVHTNNESIKDRKDNNDEMSRTTTSREETRNGFSESRDMGTPTESSKGCSSGIEFTKSLDSTSDTLNSNNPDLLINNSIKTMVSEKRPSTPLSEIDRKPIVFPLVAFYRCGFDECTFDAATSNEFREHLSQKHADALEYTCAHCGQKSFTEDSHIRHLMFHSKPQNSLLFQCCVIGCRFRANLLHIYKEHLEQAHQNVLLFRCSSCKEEFSSVDILVEHLQNNMLKFVQCPYCTMKDGIRRNVLNHISSYHPGKPRQITVTSQLICQERETNEFEKSRPKPLPVETQNVNKTPTSMTTIPANSCLVEGQIDFKQVVNNDPEDDAMINKIRLNPAIMGATYYRCHSCTYLGVGQFKLKKHCEMHKVGFVQQAQRTFVCPECPQSVHDLQQFISHLNLHIGDHLCYVYICQHCGFGTNLSNKIQSHVTGTHGSNDLGKDYTERSIRFSVKAICCTKCSAAFKTSQAHRDHVLKTHGITTNEQSGEDDLESNKSCMQTSQLLQNGETDTLPCLEGMSPQQSCEEDNEKRRFTCNECGWGTKTLSFLKHHVKRHFPKQDKCQIALFKCNYCEFTSTSKLIISSHSQNTHPGKLLRVKRIVETIHISESPEDDLSIDKFHCDMCTFSCDKISTLQSHLQNYHSSKKGAHEQNKPKDVYSGPKQEFLIPNGTVFKDVIQCSMCNFRTKKRIEILRHIKIHPALEPKTESIPGKDSLITEKVQNPLFESYYKSGMKRKSSSDGNPLSKKQRQTSPTIAYDRIMMDTAKRDTGYRKQVATKSTTNRGYSNVKSMLYFLGGEQLHMKLKPCFSEFKDSPHFYCLICSDGFEDRFQLHKHILQHMKVYFYKCAYCDHGTLDTTLVMVHIQREHRRAIQYSKLDVEEIDSHINKAIHDMKSQLGSGKEKITFDEMPKDTKAEMQNKIEETEIVQDAQILEQTDTTKEIPEKHKDTKLSISLKKTEEIKDSAPVANVVKKEFKNLQKENAFQLWGITFANMKRDSSKNNENTNKKDNLETESVSPTKRPPHKKETLLTENDSPSKCMPPVNDKVQAESFSPSKRILPKKETAQTESSSPSKDIIPKKETTQTESDSPSKTLQQKDKIQLESESPSMPLHPKIKKILDKFKCTICDIDMPTRSAAHKHMSMHSNVRRFLCSLCKYVSRWRGDITKHIDMKHKDAGGAECLWDDVTPCDLTDNGEPFNEYKYPSKFCKAPKFLSVFKATKETKEERKADLESDISDIKLNSPAKRPLKIKLSLGKQIVTKPEHDEPRNFKNVYKCLICAETFRSKHAIHQHLRIDCINPLYGCLYCKFKNVDEDRVIKHMKNSHRIVDGEAQVKSRNHKIRIIKVSKQKGTKKNNKNPDSKNAGALFKCAACKRTFKNRNAGLYHAISALCNKTLKRCSVCDFQDVSNDRVESHIKTHNEKSAKVIELPKEAKIEMIETPSSDKMHINKTGSITFFVKNGDEYRCRLCNFNCQSSAAVIQHQTMHNAAPTYSCPYCNVMKSNYIKSVRNHVKLRHPGRIIRFKTLRYDDVFGKIKDKSKEILNNSRTKDGVKEKKCIMYKCLQCNYRCETASGVCRHIKRTDTCNIPRFKCKECPRFTSLYEVEVVEHMRTTHNSKEMPALCSLKEMTKMIIVKKKSPKESSKREKTFETNDQGERSRIIDKFSGIKDIDTEVIECPRHNCSFKDKVIKVLKHYRKDHKDKTIRCKMCHMSSKSLGIMFLHFKDFHKLEDYFSTTFLVCPKPREIKVETGNNIKDEDEDNKTKQEDKTSFVRLYQCDKCEYNAKNKNVARYHIYRHLDYKKYLCRLCKSAFLLRKSVEKHLDRLHSADPELFDEIKNKRIEKEVEDLLEKIVVLKSKDDRGDYSLPEQAKSKKDEQHSPNSKKSVDSTKDQPKKDEKDLSLDTPGKKRKHEDQTEQNDFTNLDEDSFNSSSYCKEIFNKKTKNMEYLCNKCPYKSMARNRTFAHTYKHMPRCMKCPYCNFQAYPRSNVVKHLKSVHPEKQIHVIDLRYQAKKEKSPKKIIKPSPKKQKTTFLDFDAEIFTSEGSSDEDGNSDIPLGKIRERRVKLKGSRRGEKISRKTIYACHLCEYNTEVLYLYRQHLTCHAGFTHQIQGTTLESKNKCGYCGYIATNSKEFDLHVERHLNSRPFNCPYCSYSQYVPGSVKNHIRKIHPGKNVKVIKDSSSSFLTGDGKASKVLLVNLEPQLKLTDIFAMESEAFEDLLITSNVSVIDLHSIPDDQFGNVSKLLGVNGDGEESGEQSPQKARRSVIEETTEDSDVGDEVDGFSNVEIDDRNYSDASDDETHIADDESHVAQDDVSDEMEDEPLSGIKINQRNTSDTKSEGKTTNTDMKRQRSNKNEYEDISDVEMDTENDKSTINLHGEEYVVKSELTYEDISSDDGEV